MRADHTLWALRAGSSLRPLKPGITLRALWSGSQLDVRDGCLVGGDARRIGFHLMRDALNGQFAVAHFTALLGRFGIVPVFHGLVRPCARNREQQQR